GDPTRVGDRATLRSFLGYGLRAALGDRDAVRFLNDPINMTYCGEFIYVALNTVLHPFNRAGLTELLDGDAAAAEEILSLQARHNRREPTILSQKSEDAEFEALLNRTPSNPEFDAFHIGMPVVPENLLPLDQALARQGYPVPTGSLPLPPFTLSQLIRRAFRTMLPRHQGQQGGPELAAKVAAAQARVLGYLEQAIVQQLGLDAVVPETDPRRRAAHRFVQIVQQQLERPFDSQAALNQTVDSLVAKVDEMLVGYGDRTRFAPPRIYTDLGQQDGDPGLPQGWGFQLETVGALVARNVLGDPAQTQAKAWRTIEVRSPYLRGDDVQLCQGALIRRGFSVKADGIFGPASAEVVKEFQQGQGLEPTGSIDEATRQRLLAVDS
ncbi:MAG: peptidoglycan-binding domain-containing protein, partial [Cyanobacteria bacterium P01_A01_bin.135]